jgi:hypothetical protein
MKLAVLIIPNKKYNHENVEGKAQNTEPYFMIKAFPLLLVYAKCEYFN